MEAMTEAQNLPPDIQPFPNHQTPIGIVGGSGLELTDLLHQTNQRIPFQAFPKLHRGTVQGHANNFIVGYHNEIPIVLQCGRLHTYEGIPTNEVVRTVDILHALGVRQILFTNAVGAIQPQLKQGDLVGAQTITTWPYKLSPMPTNITPDFVPKGCDAIGTYQWMHGPCYETNAEINALRNLDCATVGMSTAPEMLRCAELKIRAGLISCVTNVVGGQEKLTHEHVLKTAASASQRLRALISQFLAGPP
jgi:purine-nucleoside phosphorylase